MNNVIDFSGAEGRQRGSRLQPAGKFLSKIPTLRLCVLFTVKLSESSSLAVKLVLVISTSNLLGSLYL